MNFWVALSIGLAIFVVLPILVAIEYWRHGLRADYYFDREFYDTPLTIAIILPVVSFGLSFFDEEAFNLVALLWIIGSIWVFHTIFYTLGFLHGMLRRRRREGIIG